MSRRRFVSPILALLIVFTVTIILGCEGDGENVRVENRSEEVVVVFEDEAPIALLHPNVTEEFHVLRFSGSVTYSVQSFESRSVLIERAFTWDDIVDEDGIALVVE